MSGFKKAKFSFYILGKLFNIPVKGTHAHAYVTSFSGAEDLENAEICAKDDPETVEKDFYGKCIEWRQKLAQHLRILNEEAHDGELAAFASYAVAFPDGFLALVDTYDVSRYIFAFCSNTFKGITQQKSIRQGTVTGLPT